ncbi:hypothetical protein TBLA_0E03580 [Henningerozyma blattae CBS 6284]|uniref:Tricalbin n=1 Tax=Henningerozyma blattae (strain ATCC 34711 / CBS 6284 / DSM 70876 / NBRC 10599 / NRRL Y-10934 / UCD 77-7) TaxID=1071380 RepID=I2H4W0_HENB6|nr:hypothetical protein TBLA_0E03580 [Tetrapisispora blattae CBS 6284]CCH61412.1 hypothetical protein TBLA_0E03580 [Tetrapisispora blattae CBS 6284]
MVEQDTQLHANGDAVKKSATNNTTGTAVNPTLSRTPGKKHTNETLASKGISKESLSTSLSLTPAPPVPENSSKSVADTQNIGSEEVTREAKEASYVGWKQIGNWEEKDTLTAQDELLDLNRETLLDNVLPESLYGDWYHAVGIFFIGGFLSFVLGYFKFSMAPVFFVMLITCILYRTSSKKYRASIRELVQKEFTVQKIENDYESLEWLNSFLDKYWPILEPSVSQMIVQQVNQTLATNSSIPAFIKAIWIDQFTLGVKPPRIDIVKTFQNTDSDVVVMDWGISFTPHDLSDMNAKQMRNYVNQKVVLKMKMFGFTFPVSVSEIALKAHARLRFKLMTPFPHIETVNIQLLDVPDIDLVSCIFGDSIFNWEIFSIPGLLGFVKKMAKKYMGPVLLPPFSIQLNIPQLVSGSALSIGVLEVRVKNIKDIKSSSDIMSETLDPYLTFESNGKVVAKTKVVKNSSSPVFNEVLHILVGSYTDPLSITLYDQRDKIKDKILGRAEYNLNSFHDNNSQKGLSTMILRNSKPIATMNFDMQFFPTLEKKKLPDGTIEDFPDLNTGLAKVVVEEGRGLCEVGKKLNAYVEIYLGSELVATTGKVESADTFQWNAEHEAVISDRRKTRYRFLVKNSDGETIASTVQSLNDLYDRSEIDKKYIPLKDSQGELKISLYWKPVALDLGSKTIAYTPPIGVVRLFINKGQDLKNLEAIGKIDPYVVIAVNGIPKGRIDEKLNTLNPIWNQSIYVAVTSPNQKITMDCMDIESGSEDRSVGSFDVRLPNLFQKSADDRYIECVDDEPKTGRLVSKKGIRGSITYYASFYPTVPVLTLEEVNDLTNITKKQALLKEKADLYDKKKMSKEELAKMEREERELKELSELYSNKMKLDLDELLQYNSGVLAVSVLDGELPQPNLFVQAFFDSNGHSRFTSPRISSRTIKTGWTGDVMIKELEWSVTTFRVVKNKSSNRAADCACEVSLPTVQLVKNCYKKPSILSLTGSGSAKLMVQISWFPVSASKLPQSDLITNSGDLTINVLNAENLISADSNGFSDPYLKFYLNEGENNFFKTSTQKKTLNPVWNESTQIQINNRVNDYLNIKVWDWDAANTNDLIGKAVVPLSKVDPEKDTTLDVPVVGPSGEDGGVLHLSFSFTPRYTISVNKRETKISENSGKGISSGVKAGSSVVGAGVKAGTTVVGAGLGTVGKVGKIGKGLFSKKKGEAKPDSEK